MTVTRQELGWTLAYTGAFIALILITMTLGWICYPAIDNRRSR